MNQEDIIHGFIQLGTVFRQLSTNESWDLDKKISEISYNGFSLAIEREVFHNGWFEEAMIKKSLLGITTWLNLDTLTNWTKQYSFQQKSKTIAVIMASNIPLVGFHDFLCVLISGNKIQIKLSTEDNRLFKWIRTTLIEINPEFIELIKIAEGKLSDFDAVIATGGGASVLHFKSYFSHVPHLFRGNRSSIAILTGNESDADMRALGKDIFDYFGRGCRNVSHLLLPKDFELNRFFEGIISYSEVINNKKYGNNYDYNKAIHLMNLVPFLDNNFMLLMENEQLQAPLSMVYYHYYSNEKELSNYLDAHREHLQCVVGLKHLPFGSTQEPSIEDYADGIDTMQWLRNL